MVPVAGADNLKAKLTQEEESQEFSDLPFHYFEVSRMLLERYERYCYARQYRLDRNVVDSASEDIQHVDRIRTVLKDLRERRHQKARLGLANLDGNVMQVGGGTQGSVQWYINRQLATFDTDG